MTYEQTREQFLLAWNSNAYSETEAVEAWNRRVENV